MLRQQQLDIDAARLTGTRRIGVYHHALIDEVVARGDKTAFALDLDAADAAGADFIDFLQITQGRNCDTGLCSGFHDGRALRHAHGNAVDCYVYHCLILPPLKLP